MPAFDFNLLRKISQNAGYGGIQSITPNFALNNQVAANGSVIGLNNKPSNKIRKTNTIGGGGFNIDNAIMKGSALLSGAAQIANGAIGASNISDTSIYDNRIEDYENRFVGDYYSYDQLFNDYSRLDSDLYVPTIDNIRGIDTMGKIGSVGNTAISGAMTGAAVGGPFGALAGGVLGLGAGLAGVLTGDAYAEDEQRRLQNKANEAQRNARRSLNAANEGLINYNFRSGLSNVARSGGEINRKQYSIEDFAAKVLRKPRTREYSRNPSVIRKRTQGGVIVRFKR